MLNPNDVEPLMDGLPDKFYQTLLLINNVLVRETTPNGLFRSLATTLQPLAGSDRCSLTIYDHSNDSLAWFAQAEGLTILSMDDAHNPLRGPLARTAIETRQPYIVKDLRKLQTIKAIQHMLDVGLRSAMAFPLLSRSEVIGALVLSYIRPLNDGDNELILLLQKMAIQVALAVDNMLAHTKLKQINAELKKHVGALLYPEKSNYAEERFFFQCDVMRQVMDQATRLAHGDVPVLIQGETGTGKEFIAHYIHKKSARRNNNFVKVNCPALSSSLFESELFGHVRGAFTGANSLRIGRFEMANKGSIFLDEIGDLDKILQAKLLHVLQDACFERVGESRSIHVDVRFIAATNADLHALMEQGSFRPDLFYRLGTGIIQVPPLRQRRGELRPLLQHFIRMLSADMQCQPVSITEEGLQFLEAYHWPGNVRELSNVAKSLLLMKPGATIHPEDLLPLFQTRKKHKAYNLMPSQHSQPPPTNTGKALLSPPPPPRSIGDGILLETERALIEQALIATNGVVAGRKGAAALLGLPRSTLLYKLQKHGLQPSAFAYGQERT